MSSVVLAIGTFSKSAHTSRFDTFLVLTEFKVVETTGRLSGQNNPSRHFFKTPIPVTDVLAMLLSINVLANRTAFAFFRNRSGCSGSLLLVFFTIEVLLRCELVKK